jgi:hypothetical protein
VSFEGNVAPGQANVVQVTLAQFTELAPLLLALAPNVEGLAKLGQKPVVMMISHRFMCASGHFRLLKLTVSANICAISAFDKRHFVPLHMI